VAQILTFSRKSTLDRKPLRPEGAVQEAVKMLRATLPTTIEIRKEIEGPIPAILGDPTEIHQLIVNLGTNAAHAMESSGGVMTIRLSSARLESHGEFEGAFESAESVRLEVEDTGCGIPAHLIDRIFDPFFTTKEPGKGTGLGLSVVQGIIQSVGGQIEVQSTVGEGTRVLIAIPAAPVQSNSADSQNDEIYPVGTETILFVDDEAGLVNFGQKFLSRLGYQVITATSGQKAFETLNVMRGTVQLVISDQTMPGITGLELAEMVRETAPELPIILCTGAPNESLARAAAEAGVVGLIPKPYDTRILARTVRAQLDRVRKD
jgi:CheY-like chemotaxis protein